MAKKIKQIINEELSQDQMYCDSLAKLDNEQKKFVEEFIEEFVEKMSSAITAALENIDASELSKYMDEKIESDK